MIREKRTRTRKKHHEAITPSFIVFSSRKGQLQTEFLVTWMLTNLVTIGILSSQEPANHMKYCMKNQAMKNRIVFALVVPGRRILATIANKKVEKGYRLLESSNNVRAKIQSLKRLTEMVVVGSRRSASLDRRV